MLSISDKVITDNGNGSSKCCGGIVTPVTAELSPASATSLKDDEEKKHHHFPRDV